MKLRYLSFAVCMLVAFASCTKKADKWERAAVNEVKMLTYGFYKADNPGVLIKDYVINQVSSNNISVLLPPDVDRSNLIARFTLGENDAIRVGETVQKSGETANDFTVPVDYFLADGNYNAKYTVTISKGGTWAPLPFTIIDSATSMSMKVSPVTGFPFIMYSQSRISSTDSKAAMAAYDAGRWVNLGEISDGRVGNFDFTFNSLGTPYASYGDYTTTPTAQFNTVKKFDGSSWSLVGNKGFTPVRVTYNALAFQNDSKLMVFSALDAAGGGFARRELGVSTFDNVSWATAKMPGRGTTSTYLPVAKLKNGVVYAGIYNAVTPNSFSIYKYANDTWTTLLDLWRDPNATTGNIYDFDIDVDDEGNVYAAFVDNSDGGVAKHRVIKYDAVTQAVTSVGGYIPGAVGSSVMFDLALSPNGSPFLFFRNPSNYPTIVSFDTETQDWTAPVAFESETSEMMMLDFAPNGEAYAAYTKNRKIFVQKYSAP